MLRNKRKKKRLAKKYSNLRNKMCEPDLSFSGQTYVAFSDLCGFKKMMKDRNETYKSLNYLFNSTYELLRCNNNIKALAVSDSVISWTSDRQLQSLVDFIISLHKKLIEKRYLMQTAIAYDVFKYQHRVQLENLQKAFLEGGAYLTAYTEHKKVIEGGIILVEQNGNGLEKPVYNSNFWRKSDKPKGWEYFWSAETTDEIPKILKERKESKEAQFEWLKDIYQRKYHGNPV